MIGQLVGPIANLAGSWLQGKRIGTANAKLKLVEAESKAAILMSKETSTATGRDYGRKHKELVERRVRNYYRDDSGNFVLYSGLEDVVKNGFDRFLSCRVVHLASFCCCCHSRNKGR